ncbi:hypothetical protein RclHR1_00580031 [Rhizophagus clarus]|uniref:Crinkler (CRN) family protein n=1 Tax=Rhizophagus clarus TaxID=94130 RepID=A0A2Z6RPB2_9GLOM|nr:hypothetical protein RclHR1_00580031 [Rhizophagus clarus]GES92170.1 crinkler (CRN) family protein [Rhizophagus clarus]
MQNNNLFSRYFKDELANHNKIEMESIHIIAMLIPATTAVLEGKVKDISGQFMEKLSMRPRITLPEVERLKDFIDEELPEDMKIPLTKREFDTLISDDLIDGCSPDHLEILFRVSETESALKLFFSMLAAPIFHKTPLVDGTEYSFIGFWDNNIRNPLEHLIPDCLSIRNSNKRTNARDDRPGYALILKNICLFRGEESSFTNIENTKSGLRNKLEWTYDPAPYVLGYYANGPVVTLAAICRPLENDDAPRVIDITSSNLRFRRERVLHLRRIINLSKIIECLQEVIGVCGDPEFVPIMRTDRTIEVCGKGVRKTYTYRKAEIRVQKLINIYEKLRRKGVPNVDHLEYFNKAKGKVYLTPKGRSNVPPKDQQELVEAIICVLEALVVLHDNEPLYHQDIRWPNIVRVHSNHSSKWILIDWDDAVGYPNSPASHLTTEDHAPEVFKENHGEEVDIWSVGKLITDARKYITGLSHRIVELGYIMRSDNSDYRPSAKEALKMIK